MEFVKYSVEKMQFLDRTFRREIRRREYQSASGGKRHVKHAFVKLFLVIKLLELCRSTNIHEMCYGDVWKQLVTFNTFLMRVSLAS